MRCPKHVQPLEISDVGGYAGYVCIGCKGLWLPASWLVDLEHRENRRFSVEWLRSALAAATTGRTYYPCPAGCGHLNKSLVFGFELDWCEKCGGVWFDSDELRKSIDALDPRPRHHGIPVDLGQIVGEVLSRILLLID
jgi:Zn-finger nucleic acid-binding protein